MLTGKGSRQKKKKCVKATAYPCGFTCIARKNPSGTDRICRNILKNQAATFTLWLAHQEKRLADINAYRSKKGKATYALNENKLGIIKNKLSETTKDKAIAEPIDINSVNEPSIGDLFNNQDWDGLIQKARFGGKILQYHEAMRLLTNTNIPQSKYKAVLSSASKLSRERGLNSSTGSMFIDDIYNASQQIKSNKATKSEKAKAVKQTIKDATEAERSQGYDDINESQRKIVALNSMLNAQISQRKEHLALIKGFKATGEKVKATIEQRKLDATNKKIKQLKKDIDDITPIADPSSPATSTKAIARSKPIKFNPFAKTDTTPTDFQNFFYKDRPRIKRQDDPKARHNLDYNEAKAQNRSSIPLTKTDYRISITSAIYYGLVPSDAALAEVKLTKKEQAKLNQNRQEINETRARVKSFSNAINHPLMTAEEKLGYKPTLNPEEGDKYAKGGFMDGLVVYHGTTKNGADSIGSDGMRTDLNNNGWYGQGAYFAVSKNVAENYMKSAVWQGQYQERLSVIEAKIKIKNPYVMNSEEFGNLSSHFPGREGNGVDSLALTEYVRAKGHDSIYLKELGYLVTLEKEQAVTIGREDYDRNSSRYQEIVDFWKNKNGMDDEKKVTATSEVAKLLSSINLSEENIPFYDYEKNENKVGTIY